MFCDWNKSLLTACAWYDTLYETDFRNRLQTDETGYSILIKKEHMPSVSIREVAKRAGVSRATVSRVLNRSTELLVAAETRERVRRVAVELGYHPSAVARGLAGKPMNTIGVVMAYDLPSVTSDPYLGPVLDGILEANKRRHQKTVLFTEDDWESALRNLPVYCDGHCDGLLLITPRMDSEIVPAMMRGDRPFLLVGDSREDDDLSCVDVDNVAIARDLVSQLLLAGHRRIAILCGNSDFTSNGQRLAGYRQALEQAGVPCDERLVIPGQYWEWSGRENTERLMQLPAEVRPTGLFCSNGRVVLGALQALKSLGLHVPNDVSVVTIDDNEEVCEARPPLTSAKLPLRMVGERAVESLLGQIHEGVEVGNRYLLSAQLIVGQSVRPPDERRG